MKTRRYWLFRIFCVGLLGVLSINLLYAESQISSEELRRSDTQAGTLGQKMDLVTPHLGHSKPFTQAVTSSTVSKFARLLPNPQKITDGLVGHCQGNAEPRRDDPFDDWIFYDDGNPDSLSFNTNTWSRVTFTTEFQFTLQGIQFMPYNPIPNEDAPCRVMVYSENQDSHDLDEILWETEIESLEEWNPNDEDNWHFVEIPEDEWIVFEEGENFSILYGPAPGGDLDWIFPEGFEDYELDEPPGGRWINYENRDPSFINVSDEEQHNGNNSLRFHDPEDEEVGDAFCLIWTEFADISQGSIEFWLYLSEGGTFGFDAYSAENWNNGIEYVSWFFPDEIRSNNGSNWAVVNYEYTPDEWFHVVIDFNTDEDIFSMRIDDELIIEENELVFGNEINHLRFICFSDQDMEDAYLDDFRIRTEGGSLGWWNLYDEETEVERSYVYAGDEVELSHDEWEVLDGDLLIRANGDYPNRRPAPPVIEDLTLQEDAERIIIADLDTAFFDPDGDDLHFEITEGADELQLNIDENGVLSLQPITDFCFDEPGLTVTISAEDPEGLTAETSFQVIVAPVNDPPEPFNMLTPEDGYQVRYDPDSLGTLDFTWQVAEQNEYEVDIVDYFIEFWVDGESSYRTEPLDDTAYLNIPIQHLADTLELERWDPITFNWQVWAVDSEDSALATEAPWTFTIPALGVEDNQYAEIPKVYFLSPNHPNPFNAITTIEFGLPLNGFVEMSVWDISGRRIKSLVSGNYQAGQYKVVWHAANSPTGAYVVRMKSKDFIAYRKVMLIR